jgi:hypothetical protein
MARDRGHKSPPASVMSEPLYPARLSTRPALGLVRPMLGHVWVRPAAGATVFDPDRPGEAIPAAGMWVRRTLLIEECIADALLLTEPAEPWSEDLEAPPNS